MSQRRTGIGQYPRIGLFYTILTTFTRLLNSCVYGHLFTDASDEELESLRIMGLRWKQYEKEGKWKYEGERELLLVWEPVNKEMR